jgi:DNA-binding XRE family transcriptional regulator
VRLDKGQSTGERERDNPQLPVQISMICRLGLTIKRASVAA